MFDRNGEPDSLVAPRVSGDDSCVDTDQVTFIIDQCAARIARIDGRIGLDKVFHLLDSEPSAAGRTHNSSRYRLAYSKGISNR